MSLVLVRTSTRSKTKRNWTGTARRPQRGREKRPRPRDHRKLTSEEGSPTHNTRVSIITLEQWVRTSGGRRATGYLIKCHHTTQLQSKLYGHTFQRNGQAKTSAHNRETSRVAIGKPSPYSSKESRSRSGKVDDDARMRRARTSGFTSGSVDPTGPTSR